MKSKIFILTVVSLLSLLAPAVSTAEPVSSYDSNATIQFIVPEDSPPILDPTDPQDPYDPGPGDPQDPPTEDTGPLTLDYVSSVDFGTQPIQSTEMTYESTILRPFIQVTDRRGTGAGWRVIAQMSQFTEDGTNQTLQGATVTLANGSVVSPTQGGDPTPADPVELPAGGDAALVVTAAQNEGLGSWITRWFPSSTEATSNDNVTLSVPAGEATIGEHTAIITWTLHDAPGQ